jgi:hypothetical protein
MMRVPISALTLLLGTACSSAPVESSEPGDGAPGPTGGSQTSGGTGAVAVKPVYQKQDYPEGPYGVGVGAIIEDFAFLGWRDPVSSDYDVDQFDTVRLSEFYNPGGARNDLKLIWINASAVWCSVCRFEMEDIKNRGVKATLGAKGLQLIETLFEDNGSGPATPQDLSEWGKFERHAIDYPLLLDPGFKLGAFFTSDATPLNLLVDARTMKILDATMGYSADYWSNVDELLSRL